MIAPGAARPGAATARVIRAVLRNPSLRRVLLAFLLFNSVEFGTWVAVLLYAYGTLGAAAVGVAATMQLLPAALFAAAASSVADRFPRRRVLPAGYVTQALAFGLVAAGVLAAAPPILVLTAGAVAASSLTITRPTQGALLPELARTPEELTAANGLAGTVEGAGLMLGPLAAAAILAVAQLGAVFAAATAACLLATLLVLRLAPATRTAPGPGPDGGDAADVRLAGAGSPAGSPSGPSSGSETVPAVTGGASPVARIVGGIRALGGNGDTRLVVAILGMRMLVSGALDVLMVLLAIEVLGTGDSGAGILNASFGLGTLAGGAVSFALVGRRHLSVALAASVALPGVSLVLLGTASPMAPAPLLLAIGGIGYAVVDVTGRTILQRVTDDGRLATVLGALEGIGLLALSMGTLAAPIVVGAIGIETTLAALGLVLPVTVAASWVGLRRIDSRVTVPVRELALLRANPIFSPLPAPQLESVARRMRWLTLERGDVLIREGDPGDRYYVLAEGSLRVTQGSRFLRDAATPGDGVGEIALLWNVPRTATVTAGAPSVLLALERAAFLEAVTGHEQANAAGRRVAAERVSANEGTRLPPDADGRPTP